MYTRKRRRPVSEINVALYRCNAGAAHHLYGDIAVGVAGRKG